MSVRRPHPPSQETGLIPPAGTPLTQQAHARIIEMILAGALRPGDALQEAKLGQQFAMSRTPVREAMKTLEAEGLAAYEGRFLRIRRLSAAEIEEIFFLRRELECHAVRSGIALDVSELDAMAQAVRRLMAEGPGTGDIQRRIDDRFHRLVLRGAGNATLLRTVENLRLRTTLFDHRQIPERFLAGCREHLAILEALRGKDAELAAERMSRHIEGARDAVLERLARSSSLAAENTA